MHPLSINRYYVYIKLIYSRLQRIASARIAQFLHIQTSFLTSAFFFSSECTKKILFPPHSESLELLFYQCSFFLDGVSYGLLANARAGADRSLFLQQFCMNAGLISEQYECPVCNRTCVMVLHAYLIGVQEVLRNLKK